MRDGRMLADQARPGPTARNGTVEERMRFSFEAMPNWPPLAWEASCRPGSREILVRHGERVEIGDDWFCEAAWAGEFGQGDFDRTDIVAGTGGRIRDGRVTFVSSGSTVDRLQTLLDDSGFRVSNSLACLAASGGFELDPCYPRYYEDFRSIVDGLTRVKRRVHTLKGRIELCYFDNLVWAGDAPSPSIEAKPEPARDFSSFERYEAFLKETMATVAANARDPARRFPYDLLGTLSTGYDSTTVATLAAKAAGLGEVMTFTRARGGSDDSGEAIASFLGLRCIAMDRGSWRRLDCPEIPFLASNAYGEETHYAAFEPLLSGRVLFTGYHGDKVWAKDTKSLGPDIVRGDPTGLALSEYRLHAGFLHCPVPFWGVRRIRDIHALSNAPELAAWDVPGDYSRPICRRIVESAGVPRELFGQRKNAASVVFWNPKEEFLTPASLADYRAWLGRQSWRFIKARQWPPHYVARVDTMKQTLLRLVDRLPTNAADRIKRLPGAWRLARSKSPLFRHLFAWAVAKAARCYRTSS